MPDSNTFQHKLQTYHPENALFFAGISEIAYHPKDIMKEKLLKLNFTDFFFINNLETETQGYIASNKDAVIISFRGTEQEEVKDWVRDLEFHLEDWTGIGKVHKGFLKGFNSVWADILRELKKFDAPSKTLWITGHSLGAALATLTAAKIQKDAVKPITGIYLFGSPRVGDSSFVRFYTPLKNKTYQIVNNRDIVTRVPPGIYNNYESVGTRIFINAEKKITLDDGSYKKFEQEVPISELIKKNMAGSSLSAGLGKLASLLKDRVTQVLADSVQNHFIDQYIGNLEKNRTVDPFKKV